MSFTPISFNAKSVRKPRSKPLYHEVIIHDGQSLYADPNANVRESLGHLNNLLCMPTRCGDHYARRFRVHHFNYIFEVISNEWLTARNIDNLKFGSFLGSRSVISFLLSVGLDQISHITSHLAAIRCDN